MKPRKRMSLAKRLPLWLAIAALALFAAGSAAQAQSDAPFLPNSSPDATVTMEAESYATNTAVGDYSWVFEQLPLGYSGTGVMRGLPNGYKNKGVNFDTDYLQNSPRLDYPVKFSDTGTYYIWVGGFTYPGGYDDSVHVGLDGVATANSERINRFDPDGGSAADLDVVDDYDLAVYGWSTRVMYGIAPPRLVVSTPGVHTINVWMREDGFSFDKIVLSRDAALNPTGLGPAESPRDTGGTPTVARPVINPPGGNFTEPVTVSLSTTTSGAAIYYTLNGTTPSTSSMLYSRPFELEQTATVKAIGVLSGYSDSPVASASFFIAPPGGSGAYQQDSGSNGLLSMELENHDAKTSASGHDWTFVSPANASGSGAMQALPNKGTNINSGYVTSSPRMDLAVNFVKTGVHYVWVRGQGATDKEDSLHVGLDGAAVATADRMSGFNSSWTWSKSTMDGVVAQITVSTPGLHTVNVWMREDGMVADKLVLTVNPSYTPTGLGPAESPRDNTGGTPTVAQPVIDPPGGSITESVTVRLSTTTSGAAIYYTLNGSTPSESSIRYSGPFELEQPEPGKSITVKAIGVLSGYSDSPVASALFTAPSGGSGAYQQDAGSNGLVSMELENHDAKTSASGHDWTFVSPANASGSGAMQALPNKGTNINSGYVTASPRMDLAVNFVKTGVHYVWVRGQGATDKEDSLHVGLDGAAVATADRMSRFKPSWTWSKSTMDGVVAQITVSTPGLHTINVWMREDGMVADKLVLTVNPGYTPTDLGPAESPRAP